MVYWCRWLLWSDGFISFFSTNISIIIIIINSYSRCISTYWVDSFCVTIRWAILCFFIGWRVLYDKTPLTYWYDPYDEALFACPRGPYDRRLSPMLVSVASMVSTFDAALTRWGNLILDRRWHEMSLLWKECLVKCLVW